MTVTVAVRDAKNLDRVLGRLNPMGLSPRNAEIVYPVLERLSHFDLRAENTTAPAPQLVRFKVVSLTSFEAGGWIRIEEKSLSTDAPLEHLMLLPNFTLHGETPSQAAERRRRAFYV